MGLGSGPPPGTGSGIKGKGGRGGELADPQSASSGAARKASKPPLGGHKRRKPPFRAAPTPGGADGTRTRNPRIDRHGEDPGEGDLTACGSSGSDFSRIRDFKGMASGLEELDELRRTDPDLSFVARRWPELPAPIRRAILALVQATDLLD